MAFQRKIFGKTESEGKMGFRRDGLSLCFLWDWRRNRVRTFFSIGRQRKNKLTQQQTFWSNHSLRRSKIYLRQKRMGLGWKEMDLELVRTENDMECVRGFSVHFGKAVVHIFFHIAYVCLSFWSIYAVVENFWISGGLVIFFYSKRLSSAIGCVPKCTLFLR